MFHKSRIPEHLRILVKLMHEAHFPLYWIIRRTGLSYPTVKQYACYAWR